MVNFYIANQEMNSAKWTYFTEDRVLCCRACRDSASSLITLAIAGQWSAMQALYLSELLTSPWASSTEAKQSVMTRQVFFECILCFSVKPSHLQPITNIAPWEKKTAQHTICIFNEFIQIRISIRKFHFKS